MTIAEVFQSRRRVRRRDRRAVHSGGFLEAFLRGVSRQKGERLANAEDIEKILTEVQSATAETETFKAQISGGLWEYLFAARRVELNPDYCPFQNRQIIPGMLRGPDRC